MTENNSTYYIITYGCQMNVHDSEKIAGMMEEMGYHQAKTIEDAHIILFNTCTIRENAELKVYGKVGSLKRLKRKNPDMIIGVGGCMMQSEEAADKLYKKFPQVDLIFGTHNLHRIPDLIKRIEKERGRIVEVWDKEKGLIPDLPSSREDDHRAWVSIIQGCNNFCTYCIVPYVRGRERSRPLNDIVKKVEKLVSQGVLEVTLLGQNVNSYGKDLPEKVDFAELLKRLDTIENLARIRYMTSHPRDFNKKLISTTARTEKVCEHFHLPVQSGSSRILKKMNRGYTKEKYINLVREIRKSIPDSSITTDFIVGFPGETDEDFAETINLVRELRFDMAFTFIYSPRSGTIASTMEDQISEEVKKKRLEQLMEIQNTISLEKNKEMMDKTVEVLVEGESKTNPEMFCGRTRQNKLIIFPKEEDIEGKLTQVKINEVQSFTLFGKITEKNGVVR